MHCPISNAESREEQRAIRPAKGNKSVVKLQKHRSTEGRLGAQGSVGRAADVVFRGHLGCTALMEWGVRVGEDESGAPLGERHQSLVHCEKQRSKVLLALPTAAPGVPG